MFTGIVEEIGEVHEIQQNLGNIEISLRCSFIDELKVDQSIAHNGVCLTITEISADNYKVVAIEETLKKSNIGNLRSGSQVNLERCLRIGDRLDGHLVQGHVDCKSQCTSVVQLDGSWEYNFTKDSSQQNLIVPKGSICINGVSLTVVEVSSDAFSVAIIPYTYEHTNFKEIHSGSEVNIEFDIIGKYLNNQFQSYMEAKSATFNK